MIDDPKPEDIVSYSANLIITVTDFEYLRQQAKERFGNENKESIDKAISAIVATFQNARTRTK